MTRGSITYSEEQILKLFENIKIKWGKITQKNEISNSDVLAEVGERLSQLKWIFKRIWVLEKSQQAFLDNVRIDEKGFPVAFSREEVETQELYTKEERILTESFYYISWRVSSILNHIYPEFIKKITGIDNVRNKLIEHPWDKDSKVFINSFGCCGPKGPVIKSIRPNHQVDVYPDNGLWSNLIEFLNAIISIN